MNSRIGRTHVVVEHSDNDRLSQADIAFKKHQQQALCVELKTSNMNWMIQGVLSKAKPITKNIRAIISDSQKTSSCPLIVAFDLFPIGLDDLRWEEHVATIIAGTGIELTQKTHYQFVEMKVEESRRCQVLVCTFVANPVPPMRNN